MAFRRARLQDLAITERDGSWEGAGRRAAGGRDALPYGTPGNAGRGGTPAAAPAARAIGSAGERLVHTEEVTGSIPVSPTQVRGRFTVREPVF
jgi:hypothetical protein